MNRQTVARAKVKDVRKLCKGLSALRRLPENRHQMRIPHLPCLNSWRVSVPDLAGRGRQAGSMISHSLLLASDLEMRMYMRNLHD